MIDETIYKIALAGFLHDIGKFAERADFPLNPKNIETDQSLFQPYFNHRYTHKHALYTASVIEEFGKSLPESFQRIENYAEESLLRLAALHHKPSTALQWIIAIADRVSSGFDRSVFEEQYNNEIQVKDYKKTRLLTIFEGLSSENKWKSDSLEDYQYRYPLKELSPNNIFPANSADVRQIDSNQAVHDYKQLFLNFQNALKSLSHKENIPLWFEHFDSLFMIFTSHIPAATVGYVVPDVSLYDHCRTTSAIASALYLYHKESGTMTEQAIKDYNPNKFLLISGNFYGIQDFIFTEGGSTGKASAKLLRGRSFYISLLSELAADMLCKELALPATSIILNAAGRFTILAYNTDRTKETVKTVEGRINDWLIRNFYGQASMGLSVVEASCNDFVNGKFAELWQRLSKETVQKKCSKFDLSKHGGCVETYLDSFDNEIGICPFCAKRPADKSAKVRDTHACNICRDHVYIGENLVKEDRIAITTPDADLQREKLLEPIFGQYQISFKVSGKLNQLSESGSLLKYWDIGISEKGEIAKDITAKFINGYVPKYDNDDLHDDRYFAGKKSEKKKLDMIDQIRADKDESIPKTFAHIAVKALNFTDNPNKFKGIEALGILKADVDNLGLLFACGMREERLTLSRLATMSRQMNNYFSIFLPYKLKIDDRFKNIYTVFAGGDDLFLIGAWNKIIEFADFLNKSFKEYVCQNDKITISAGIALHKPNTPVLTLAETSEHALHASKSKGRNSITIFGETAKWSDFTDLEGIKKTIEDWLDSEMINNAMLFRLNEFIEMRRQEEEITKNGSAIYLEDMECLKWRARLKYTIVRNIGKKLKGEDKEQAINTVMQTAKWLETYGSSLKIPLWQVIYNRR